MNSETWLLSMCCGAAAIPLGFAAWSWLSGNRNGADCPPADEGSVIKSDVPEHPEYATQAAARIVNERLTGRNLGPDLHVYVNADADHADWHSQQRYTDWMLEKGRAASVGVHVHKVGWRTRDEMGAGEQPTTWHSTAPVQEGGITTERKPGSVSPVAVGVFFALIACGGLAVVAAIVLR